MATPGVRATGQDFSDEAELPPRLTTAFRGSAARGNYLGPDRCDTKFATKEICRSMSTSTMQSWQSLKRICRFFKGKQCLVYMYPPQRISHVDVHTDTDWVGCPRARKSISGGKVLSGRHTVKHWLSTQNSSAVFSRS